MRGIYKMRDHTQREKDGHREHQGEGQVKIRDRLPGREISCEHLPPPQITELSGVGNGKADFKKNSPGLPWWRSA